MATTEYLFNRLSLEIKHMIFKQAAVSGSDVQVSLVNDDDSELDAPALEFLSKLQQISPQTYLEAAEYLAGPLFRWVFISKFQPHRYLLDAFSNHAPKAIRRKIVHAYLPRFLYEGESTSSTPSPFEFPRHGIFDLPEYDEYIDRINDSCFLDYSGTAMTLKRDSKSGLTRVSRMLPSLKRLDLGLDILECQYFMLRDTLWFFEEKGDRYQIGMSEVPASWKQFTTLHKVDLRIFWDDFLQARLNMYVEPTDARTKLQDTFVRWLREALPAKSITSCCLTDTSSTTS